MQIRALAMGYAATVYPFFRSKVYTNFSFGFATIYLKGGGDGMASNTQHFKGFSVVQGDIKVNVSLARFEKQFQEAQRDLDIAVMKSMLPLMPHYGTGNFIQRTQAESTSMAGTGIVCAAAGPYGRFLYEGKTMVDILTGSSWARSKAKKVLVSQYSGKTNAKEDLTFSRPGAVPHWFDEAKKRDLKEWVSLVKRTAGGGTRG